MDDVTTPTRHPTPALVNHQEIARDPAGKLGWGRLHDAQRKALASQIGQRHGNQHLQRVVASLGAGASVQREAEEEEDTESDYQRIDEPVSVTIALSPPAVQKEHVVIETYSDLGAAYEALMTVMFLDRHTLMPDADANEHWEAWDGCYESAKGYRDWYLDDVAQADRPFRSEVRDLQRLARQANNIGQDGHRSFVRRDTALRKELGQVLKELDAAEKMAKDVQRIEFLGGEPDTDQTAATVWSLIDKLASLSNIAAQAAQDLNTVVRIGADLLPSAVSLANLVANWATTTPAMYGTAFEGLATLNNVVALGGAAHGFVGSPATIVAEYIGPMLSTITAMLGKLQMRMIERNDTWTEQFGTPVYVGAEPGGEEMWNYMVRTMRAPSAGDVPTPTGEVYDYFDEFRERFNEFTSSYIPAEGMLIQDIDKEAFPTWLYNHREQVWVMLYGSRDPKKAKPV